jgi:hypothetical protein
VLEVLSHHHRRALDAPLGPCRRGIEIAVPTVDRRAGIDVAGAHKEI